MALKVKLHTINNSSYKKIFNYGKFCNISEFITDLIMVGQTKRAQIINFVLEDIDDRFAKALDVDYFALPTDIAYVRFPEWYFCPKCRTFQPLKKWIADYKKKAKGKMLELDENMVTHIQCPTCKQDLVVSRIVTVCEDGHLNDFPWVKWVHARSKKPICGNPSLKFKTGASGSEGLEGLLIECSCGAHSTLKDAFDKDIFEKMDQEEGTFGFRCEGHHPFKHIQEP